MICMRVYLALKGLKIIYMFLKSTSNNFEAFPIFKKKIVLVFRILHKNMNHIDVLLAHWINFRMNLTHFGILLFLSVL